MFSTVRLAQRQYSTVRFSTQFDAANPKPTLAQFKYPLFHVFLIASSTYMAMNAWWYALEYKEKEQKLQEAARALDLELQAVIDEKKAVHAESHPKKSWFRFWR